MNTRKKRIPHSVYPTSTARSLDRILSRKFRPFGSYSAKIPTFTKNGHPAARKTAQIEEIGVKVKMNS